MHQINPQTTGTKSHPLVSSINYMIQSLGIRLLFVGLGMTHSAGDLDIREENGRHVYGHDNGNGSYEIKFENS
ncbi:hypothetical protein Ddc_12798 [Ditylenchus destructor]|nr:hypothetical protein Ddc_12798 [Ditylenchus destructor]